MTAHTAILIIDAQVAMFSYENHPLYNGDTVLQNIKLLLDNAREKNIPVIFIQHTECEEFEKGTPTWEICPEIAPLSKERVIEKTTCDSFHKTDLQEELQKLGITDLIIMGMQTEYCVDTTCRRAFSLGYHNIIVSDAHSTFDTEQLSGRQIVEHHNQILNGSFAQLKSADEVLELLSK
ncbi:cysteine hydrolase [Bacillaceae bacterium Marseille-Q3522]|nr:cysteine hydrolase [Bacillaceae bacterium Marseille-Q3522]